MHSPNAQVTSQRAARWIECLILVVAGAMLVCNAVWLGETYDERAHVNSGVAFLREGIPDLDPCNPPLRAILALPAWAEGMPAPAAFLSAWPNPKDRTYLVSARLVQVALVLLFAWALGRWTARRIGPATGLVAMALMLFEPTTAAFGCLATTDALIMETCFLLTVVTFEWMRRPSWRLTPLWGMAIGLALMAKYSSLVWGAGLALGMIAFAALDRPWRRVPAPLRLRAAGRRLAQMCVAALIAWALLAAAYGFEGIGRPIRQIGMRDPSYVRLAGALGAIPSPLPARYLRGMDELRGTIAIRTAYFVGQHRRGGGFFWYFPLLLIAKPSLALLGLWVMAIAGCLAGGRRRGGIRTGDVAFFALPALCYFGFSCFSRIQNGVRLLSPIFPLLILAAAWGATALHARWWRGIGLGLAISVVALSLHLGPHHLAYFNPILGGPENAWRWYNDSNQDWGQSRGDLEAWGMRTGRKVKTHPVEGWTTGWVALSTNARVGFTPEEHEKYRWVWENYERRYFVLPYWHVYEIPPGQRSSLPTSAGAQEVP